MSDSKRSFWSTVPGVVTGAASVLTAIVGLLTVAISLGWIGSNGDDSKPAANGGAPTTSSVNSTSSTAFGATTTTVFGRTSTTLGTAITPLQATPSDLTFDSLGARDQTVTVRNGSAASVALRKPSVSGVDASQFTATDLTCGTRIDANRTCEVRVTYLATKTGTASAKLVVQPDGPPALEVPLKGSRLI
jgi:hypothetical protein